jgi:Predicted membrane protein
MSAIAVKGQKEWRRPRDGKEFVGVLVGGYSETRKEIIAEVWKRYGIRVVNHFGLEKRKEMSLYIRSDAEICIILSQDIDPMLPRVLKACAAGMIPTIGIERRPHTWDTAFATEGFSNPPKWRDGFLIDNPADPVKLEEQRKKELAELEKPRVAWTDPKLAVSPKPTLADVAPPVSQIVKNIMAAPAPGKRHVRGPVNNKFAILLRKTRTDAGLSQAQLAKKMETRQSVVSRWEHETEPSLPLYEAYLKLREILPGLPVEVEGMQGKKVFEERARREEKAAPKKSPVSLVPPPAPYVPPGTKTAAQAFGAAPAKAPEPERTPPPPPAPVVVETPAPPPPVAPVAPPPPKEDPEVFAKRVIAAMAPPAPAAQVGEELLTVRLRSGGSITLTASVSLMKLKGPDRKFVFDMIDMLQAYEDESTEGLK